jgi:urea transporter
MMKPVWGVPCFTLPFNVVGAIFLLAAFQFSWFPRADTLVAGFPVQFNPATSTGVSFVQGLQAILLGVSQIVFVGSWQCALLMVGGFALCLPKLTTYLLIGSTMGFLTGLILGADPAALVIGLWGYNSALGAAAVAYFYHPSIQCFFMSILCAILSALFFACLLSIFSVWAIPALTFPFCLGAVIIFLLKSSVKNFTPKSEDEDGSKYGIWKQIQRNYNELVSNVKEKWDSFRKKLASLKKTNPKTPDEQPSTSK